MFHYCKILRNANLADASSLNMLIVYRQNSLKSFCHIWCNLWQHKKRHLNLTRVSDDIYDNEIQNEAIMEAKVVCLILTANQLNRILKFLIDISIIKFSSSCDVHFSFGYSIRLIMFQSFDKNRNASEFYWIVDNGKVSPENCRVKKFHFEGGPWMHAQIAHVYSTVSNQDIEFCSSFALKRFRDFDYEAILIKYKRRYAEFINFALKMDKIPQLNPFDDKFLRYRTLFETMRISNDAISWIPRRNSPTHSTNQLTMKWRQWTFREFEIYVNA